MRLGEVCHIPRSSKGCERNYQTDLVNLSQTQDIITPEDWILRS
jgi:hypothetical protein